MATLTEVLNEQAKGHIEIIDMAEYRDDLTGLTGAGYWALFQAWGLYAGSADPNIRRTQTYEIEGVFIDHIFISPEDDWWYIRDFLRDYYAHMDTPMAVADAAEIMGLAPVIRSYVLGAYLSLAVNIYQNLRSSDMSNERIRELLTVIATDWLDWWSSSHVVLETLDIDEHNIDYSEFCEAARLLGTVFAVAEDDEVDDVDEDEPEQSDLEE